MNKLALGLGLLGVVAAATGTLAAKEAAKKEIVSESLEELAWKEMMPGMPLMAAEVWKGPGGSGCFYLKFPKGMAVPLHWHSKDAHAVVISGNWGSTPEGGQDKLLSPGSHQFIPGKVKHTTKCGEAADCVIYSCSPGAFDVKGLPPPPK
jgi:quercetin dioxygenase-like cupin family protein